MAIISPYSIIGSLRSVNMWQQAVNANSVGATKAGYKEMDVMFGGGLTTTIVPIRGNEAGVARAEDTVRVGHTYINFTQGNLVKSTSDDHYAIDGQGFFMVADKTGKVYYTRNGEFYDNGMGQLMNTDGLILVDRAVAINMGLYTAPAPTLADIDNDDTGWVNMGGNRWVPYVAGTKYEEAGNYQNMTVNAKKTFFMDENDLTGAETVTIRTDNAGYVFINGNLLTTADVTNGGPYPTDWSGPTVFDIGPYLVPGANTILIQSTEQNGGEVIDVSADTVTNVNLTTVGANISTWAVEVNPDGYEGNPYPPPLPSDGQKGKLLSTDLKDMILALPPALQELVYSSFSALYFDDPKRAVNLIPKSLPDQNGFGRVFRNSLESSNVNMAKSLTNLTGVKSMADVLAKQFATFIAQVDIGINLVV